MPTTNANEEEGTDQNEHGPFGEPDVKSLGGAIDKTLTDDHEVLGTDVEGETHHWDSQNNVVHVVSVDAPTRTHRHDLQGRDLSEYIEFVGDLRGWA